MNKEEIEEIEDNETKEKKLLRQDILFKYVFMKDGYEDILIDFLESVIETKIKKILKKKLEPNGVNSMLSVIAQIKENRKISIVVVLHNRPNKDGYTSKDEYNKSISRLYESKVDKYILIIINA